MSAHQFFSEEQEARIVKAIQQAEKNTSGEIRVHIDSSKQEKEAMDRAVEVFDTLEMHKTKAKNGVLFYLSTENKQFVVLGDVGINKVVPTDFWETTKEKVINQFKLGNFTEGLVAGILEAGEQLKKYFAYESDDVNELSDEISKE